jgi:small subunit ribosomal protein S2
MVDYKVPGNDDAIRAIRLFCSAVADAINEGRTLYEQSLIKRKEEERADAPNVNELSAAAGV